MPSFVKTSLSPGSGVVTRYLNDSGVTPFLEKLGYIFVCLFVCEGADCACVCVLHKHSNLARCMCLMHHLSYVVSTRWATGACPALATADPSTRKLAMPLRP